MTWNCRGAWHAPANACANVPEPRDIFWKVRNGGTEALRAGQLRGEMRRDEMRRSLVELAADEGARSAESYAVKNGGVHASDRRAVVVI
jgi:hypothetical protein